MEECAEEVSGAYAQMSTAFTAYQDWCRANGFMGESIRTFGLSIRSKGYRVDHRKTGKYLVGIRVISPSISSLQCSGDGW